MMEPEWVERLALLALHDRSLALHGGAPGLRDEGLMESALLRPQNRFHYEGEEDLCALAATYGVALAKNHPFVDGNKRAAFAAVGLFLGANGLKLRIDDAEATAAMLAVASGELALDGFAAWLRNNTAAA